MYGDPCQWATTGPDEPATTVDELVAALAAQASRDASEPVDVTVDGYAGKAIILHVPDDVDVNGELAIIDAAYYAGTPTEHVEELRAIVDSISFEAP